MFVSRETRLKVCRGFHYPLSATCACARAASIIDNGARDRMPWVEGEFRDRRDEDRRVGAVPTSTYPSFAVARKMWSWGMVVVVAGAIGCGAMTEIRRDDPALVCMGQSGGAHSRQDESPSQEDRDQ